MPAAAKRPADALAQSAIAVHATTLRERLGGLLVALGNRVAGTAYAGTAAAPGHTLAGSAAATGNDRFASLASMIPGVVYQRVVKPDGDIRYTYMSEGAREMFGVSPEQVLEDPEALFSTYGEDYKASFRQRLIAASKTLTTWDVEASVVAPDGQMRYNHAIAKPERLRDGSVLWTGLILDATRIKQVEEKLKAATRSVEAANQAKSMFLANMSHEIRTPMNGVLGMTDLLLKTDLDGRQQRLLSTLKHSAQTLLAIINDVLDISRIEAGHFNLENESFDLHRCLEDAVDLSASAAYKKGLEINLIAEGGLPVMVKGDGGRLRQVLINLVGNAVKFTQAGEATIRAYAGPIKDGRANVTIEVIDTGIGIDPAAKEKLFAPFAQADSSISRRFGGTGLGLAITRHLITLMGGTVELDSEVGRGTKVTVRLPLEVISHRNGSILLEPLSDQRILIVDDRPRVRETIASKLAGTGALLAFAGSEDDTIFALQRAAREKRPYSAVILDRLQPGTDSLVLSEKLRADLSLGQTALINVVSMNWRGTAEQASLITLSKPIRRSDILSALRHRLPLQLRKNTAKEDPDQEASPASSAAAVNLGLTVLLAEDNPVNQEVAREYLSGYGCSVTIAQDGEEAVELLTRGSFDIVLMDCQMPVMDGLSAVRRFRELEQREQWPRMPVIAATANAYDSDRVDALAAGMDDYLVKPFSDTALLEMLQKWQEASPRKVARAGTQSDIMSVP